MLVDARRRWQRGNLGSHLGTILCGNGRIGQNCPTLMMDPKEQFVIAETAQPIIGIDSIGTLSDGGTQLCRARSVWRR
jgi:hypothetical protein